MHSTPPDQPTPSDVTASPVAPPSVRAHLVLSGGGVNCLAFIGALEALERADGANYRWASISTCSFGTLIGAWRSAGLDPSAMRDGIMAFDVERLRVFSRWQLARRITRLRHAPGLVAESPLPVLFDAVSGLDSNRLTLGELDPPVAAAAVDVDARRLVVYSRDVRPAMTVRELLQVATAVPPLIGPVRVDGHDMVDAAVSWSAPIWLTAAFDEDLPIVVLRTGAAAPRGRRSVVSWLFDAQRAGIVSHDTFQIDQTPRLTLFEFVSPHKPHAMLTVTQRGALMDTGRAHVEDQLERATATVVPGGLLPADADWATPTASAEAIYAGILYRRHQQPNDTTVFISYAHEDREYVADLRNHLRPIIANRNVAVWDDSYITDGADWNWTIRNAIERSRAAIVLVSSNLTTSSYIATHELKLLLERSGAGKTTILVVRIDHSPIPTELQHLQVVNYDTPLATVRAADRDTCLARITDHIETLITPRTAGTGVTADFG